MIDFGLDIRNNLNNRYAVYYKDNVILKNQGCVSPYICISFNSWELHLDDSNNDDDDVLILYILWMSLGIMSMQCLTLHYNVLE